MSKPYRIGIERLQDLLIQEVLPANYNEELLMIGFNRALMGDLLFNVILSLKKPLEKLDEYEKDMLYLGYSLGQKSDNEKQFGTFNNNEDDDGVIH